MAWLDNLTDPRPIGPHLDPLRAQSLSRTDSGAHQKGGRMDAAERNNDVVAEELFLLAAD